MMLLRGTSVGLPSPAARHAARTAPASTDRATLSSAKRVDSSSTMPSLRYASDELAPATRNGATTTFWSSDTGRLSGAAGGSRPRISARTSTEAMAGTDHHHHRVPGTHPGRSLSRDSTAPLDSTVMMAAGASV